MKLNHLFILIIIGSNFSCENQKHQAKNTSASIIEKNISSIQNDYVTGWKEMDEKKVLSLFEENARIQPNSLKPIEGKEELRNFWFPKDSSVTKINEFKTELLSINVLDTLVLASYKSYLDWSYEKGTYKLGMAQTGFTTTLYRKQTDNSWKIWRQMWTDTEIENKK